MFYTVSQNMTLSSIYNKKAHTMNNVFLKKNSTMKFHINITIKSPGKSVRCDKECSYFIKSPIAWNTRDVSFLPGHQPSGRSSTLRWDWHHPYCPSISLWKPSPCHSHVLRDFWKDIKDDASITSGAIIFPKVDVLPEKVYFLGATKCSSLAEETCSIFHMPQFHIVLQAQIVLPLEGRCFRAWIKDK